MTINAQRYIKVTEYELLFDGQKPVYRRLVEFGGDGSSLMVAQVVLPKRYAEATEDQVVEYLQTKAKDLAPAAKLFLPGASSVVPGKSLLEQLIMNLPDEIIRAIVRGDEDYMKFVRSHTMAPAIEEGESPPSYVYVRYGMVPAHVIADNEKTADGKPGPAKEPEWYDAVLSHSKLRENGFGELWNVRLLLNNGVLPDRAEMEILLKHGTYSSRTFDVSRVHYNENEMRTILDLAYDILPNASQIAELPDISEARLEELTMQPVIKLHEQVKGQIDEVKRAQAEAQQRGQGPGGNRGPLPGETGGGSRVLH